MLMEVPVASERHVKLFKDGRNQAVRIPREFELPGEDAIMRKEGERLIIEPIPPKPLMALLQPSRRSTKTFRRSPNWHSIPSRCDACRSSRIAGLKQLIGMVPGLETLLGPGDVVLSQGGVARAPVHTIGHADHERLRHLDLGLLELQGRR